MDKKLVKYIRENSAKGFSHDEIIERLKNEGWEEEAVTSAFEQASEEHKTNMRTWFAVGGFAAFIVLFLIVYFGVLSPTVEKPVVEKPEINTQSAGNSAQAQGAQAEAVELQSGTEQLLIEQTLPEESVTSESQTAHVQEAPPASPINAKQLEYVLVELGLYKLHPNPFTGALPEIEVVIADTGQIFDAVIENNLVNVASGNSGAPDARVEVDSYAVMQILSASDETQVQERAAQLFKERQQRGYDGELIAGNTDLLLKGYLGLYNELKSIAGEPEITGNAITEIDATASQFVGAFVILVVLWAALILRMALEK